MNRAYSTIELKAAGEDERVIEGMASTPSTDRMGDIVEPLGAQFSLPLPALLFHDSKNPVATVEWAKPNKNGIPFRIRFPKAGLLQKVDEAFTMVKAGLIRAVSIGFREIESSLIKETGGIRFTKWELLEISLVSVPANADATITSIKSLDAPFLAIKSADTELRAASGNAHGVVRLGITKTFPGVTGSPKKENSMTLKEQIAQFENKYVVSDARLTELTDLCQKESRSFEANEQEEVDALEAELKKIKDHVEFLKRRDAASAAKAAPVKTEEVDTPEKAAKARRGEPIQVKSNAPKGIAVARMAIALYEAGGIKKVAAQVAKDRWPDSPEIATMILTKSGVDAGDTTTSGWASQLVAGAGNPTGEFLELLRDATILGRIPGFRKVPFNVAIPVQSGGGTYQWVGEAMGKPVTSATFDSVTLRWAKAAGIIVITEELAKFSTPSAEMIIRDEMLKGCAAFLDAQFISAAAEVSNVSPAGILNGITPTAVSGATPAAFRTDMYTLLNKFAVNKVDPSKITLLMSATQAIALSLMNTDLGVSLFPNIAVSGGSVLGMPVVVSQAVGTKIIAINASDILVAEDGGLQIDMSREASVEMETNPAVGEQSPLSTLTNLKSLWQNNLVGFRVERYITWKKARTSAVEYLTANAYVPS